MRRALVLCRVLGACAVIGLTSGSAAAVAGVDQQLIVTSGDELRAALGGSALVSSRVVLGADIATGQLALLPGAERELDLAGHRLSVVAIVDGHAGIAVPEGASLTLADDAGSGLLTAAGATDGAGIGGGAGAAVGSVVVDGAHVEATGGACGAGIGTGDAGTPGAIRILSGTVEANAGDGAAAIGGGCDSAAADVSIGEHAVVTAAGTGAAAIGPGVTLRAEPDRAAGGAADDAADLTRDAEAPPHDAGSPGSIRNAGVLRIRAGSVDVPATSTAEQPGLANGGRLVIDDDAALHALGIVVNAGAIVPSSRVTGVANIVGNNVTIGFDAGSRANAVPSALVLALSWSDVADVLPVPERAGARFAGWIGADGMPVTPTTPLGGGAASLTLVADWRVEVTFRGVDGVRRVEIPAGAPVAEPTPPGRGGYVFVGWATAAGETWRFADAVEADLVLEPVWERATDTNAVVDGARGEPVSRSTTRALGPASAPPVSDVRDPDVRTPDAQAEVRVTGDLDPAMLGVGALVVVMIGTLVSGFRIGRSN